VFWLVWAARIDKIGSLLSPGVHVSKSLRWGDEFLFSEENLRDLINFYSDKGVVEGKTGAWRNSCWPGGGGLV
jgi:hypothetical protein